MLEGYEGKTSQDPGRVLSDLSSRLDKYVEKGKERYTYRRSTVVGAG